MQDVNGYRRDIPQQEYEFDCEVCGKHVAGIGYPAKRKYCSDECRLEARREWDRQAKAASRPPGASTDMLCVNCGKAFTGRPDQKYCRVECGREHYRKRLIGLARIEEPIQVRQLSLFDIEDDNE